LPNYSMLEKLRTGQAHDVNVIGEEVEEGVWELHNFMDDVDYCDAESEEWICSIGRAKETGVFYAATDARFVDNPDFDLVWVR
jgi:hypothetical protein